jgi:hypothetical protein
MELPMKVIPLSKLIAAARAGQCGALVSTGKICVVLAKAFDALAKRSQKAALVASTPPSDRP